MKVVGTLLLKEKNYKLCSTIPECPIVWYIQILTQNWCSTEYVPLIKNLAVIGNYINEKREWTLTVLQIGSKQSNVTLVAWIEPNHYIRAKSKPLHCAISNKMFCQSSFLYGSVC